MLSQLGHRGTRTPCLSGGVIEDVLVSASSSQNVVSGQNCEIQLQF